ncbi:RagB/SusD family nutrient uptake outer membrane protein [Maribellus comscasis]|uniref:RagB/SusD family nutrient uptake outer membrane protein n=1 Tax=Maribellus comscasis TaxID=2681766 RepID=A0A6I6JMX2_9BACT|nr:RagB/SusD family nutrient uptake outer membrane protein [Maribellus comscasis]QGY44296.1 RagB/SusD family nutrient uptake outer membrane protein [Maribellus comscasis]
MKKLIYLLIVIIIFGACDSLVEEEVYSTITPNNFFQSERDVTTALVGVYDGIQDLNIWWRLFYTSECIGGLMRHNWSPWAESMVYEDDQGDIWNLWYRHYDAISRANAVLGALEGSTLDDAIKSRYEAEVKFIRAYAYFNLVRMFGQIPLVTKSPESLNDVLAPDSTNVEAFESEFLKQRERDDIYDFIVEDLKFAELNLPSNVTESDAGRVSSGAASGMLARVYLAMAGKQYDYNSGQLVDGDASLYGDVAQQCEKVIAAGNYDLLQDYPSIYEVANNEEILFSIQYLESAVAGVTGEGNQIVARTGVRGATDYTPYSWLQCSVNETFWEDFIANNTKNDNRYMRTFLEYYVSANGDTVWNGSSNTFKRPHVRKFLTDVGPETSAQNATDYGADWIVLRYADVLLMHSEALNEAGSTPDANTIKGINEVLDRAGQPAIELPISKDELRERIWQERKWELCFEGLHYFDCQRTGRLLEEFTLNVNPARKADATLRNYIYPIPFNAREANPSLKQNAGW